jgi:tyrosinase
MPTPANITNSRYERFQQLLRDAAGDSPSDYGGLGPFWELPLERLLQASLYGVRLIAPEGDAKPSCCSHGIAAGQSRADRSGLIQGLRGDPPFDGSRLPRLPWGGRALADEDITTIADWMP